MRSANAVGYGSWIPLSTVGKVVVFVCALLGLAVVSLLVLAINIKLHMKPNDQKAFVVLSKFDLAKRIRKTAALIIYKFFKVVRYHRRGELAAHARLLVQIRDLCSRMRQDQRNYRSRKNPNLSEDMLRRFEDFKLAQQAAKFGVSLAGLMISSDLEHGFLKTSDTELLSEILSLPLDSEEFRQFQRELNRKRPVSADDGTEDSERLRNDKGKLLLFRGIDQRKQTVAGGQPCGDCEDSASEAQVRSIRQTATFKRKF